MEERDTAVDVQNDEQCNGVVIGSYCPETSMTGVPGYSVKDCPVDIDTIDTIGEGGEMVLNTLGVHVNEDRYDMPELGSFQGTAVDGSVKRYDIVVVIGDGEGIEDEIQTFLDNDVAVFFGRSNDMLSADQSTYIHMVEEVDKDTYTPL